MVRWSKKTPALFFFVFSFLLKSGRDDHPENGDQPTISSLSQLTLSPLMA